VVGEGGKGWHPCGNQSISSQQELRCFNYISRLHHTDYIWTIVDHHNHHQARNRAHCESVIVIMQHLFHQEASRGLWRGCMTGLWSSCRTGWWRDWRTGWRRGCRTGWWSSCRTGWWRDWRTRWWRGCRTGWWRDWRTGWWRGCRRDDGTVEVLGSAVGTSVGSLEGINVGSLEGLTVCVNVGLKDG